METSDCTSAPQCHLSEPAPAPTARHPHQAPRQEPARHQAPVPTQEPARLADLRAQQLLDTLPEAMFDDIARVASAVCGTPIALISLVDSDRQWFKAKVGLQATQTPREQAFCAHAILDPHTPLVVPDATQDARFAHNPLVTGAPDIRLYAGAPIVSAAGHALGTVCVIDNRPRELSAEQIECLQALSRQASNLIEYRRIIRSSVDSVQLQLLAKSEKLRATQVQSEQRAQRLAHVVHTLQQALVEPLRALGSSAQALEDRLGAQEAGARVHVESIKAAIQALQGRLETLQQDIEGPSTASPG